MSAKPPPDKRAPKGPKPQNFQDPATDSLLAMVLALTEEVSVLRDRLDTVERLLGARGVLTQSDIEDFDVAGDVQAERAQRRTAFLERVMRTVLDDAARAGES